ncbi:MAG: peptide deformylase [Proteobacteria bacterium]|nr:peptide deformylase [Pseudomonadota bacterium]MDA0869666.1 peptide deformylase [Pseudomonadota bacterium]MDA1328377.1 peptide deformylase [Pseudomonadota bacterium]
MALLTILTYPNPRLHTVAEPVAAVDDDVRQLVQDMLETMYDAKGVGLAATQVDVHRRVLVADVSETRDQPQVFINPTLVWASAQRQVAEEGCLSVPGYYDGVERALEVRVQAWDALGQSREVHADGLLAVCLQHEMDHLAGKVFVEYLSPLKRNRLKTKLQKQAREARV